MPYIKDYEYTKVTPEMVPNHPERAGRWYVHIDGDKPWLQEGDNGYRTKKEAYEYIRSVIDRSCWPVFGR